LFLDSGDVDEDSWNQELHAAHGSLAKLDRAARWAKLKWLRASFERGMCLLKQPYFREEGILVEQHLAAANERLHETIQIARFTRYEVPAA
jgi:translation elongation factor EF-Ts